jgi:hypothetical protein
MESQTPACDPNESPGPPNSALVNTPVASRKRSRLFAPFKSPMGTKTSPATTPTRSIPSTPAQKRPRNDPLTTFTTPSATSQGKPAISPSLTLRRPTSHSPALPRLDTLALWKAGLIQMHRQEMEYKQRNQQLRLFLEYQKKVPFAVECNCVKRKNYTKSELLLPLQNELEKVATLVQFWEAQVKQSVPLLIHHWVQMDRMDSVRDQYFLTRSTSEDKGEQDTSNEEIVYQLFNIPFGP